MWKNKDILNIFTEISGNLPKIKKKYTTSILKLSCDIIIYLKYRIEKKPKLNINHKNRSL